MITTFHYVLVLCATSVTVWFLRLYFADKALSRSYGASAVAAVVSQLEKTTTELAEMKTFLNERNKVQEKALSNAIAEFRDIVKFEENKVHNVNKEAAQAIMKTTRRS